MSALDRFRRILLGVVFAVAAVSSLRGRTAYRGTRTTAMALGVPAGALAGALAGVVAALLPIAEGGTVALLAILPTVPFGYLLAAAMLAAFAVAIAVALSRGRHVACRCFGAGDPIGRRHLARNGILLLVCGAGVAAHLAAPVCLHVVPTRPWHPGTLAPWHPGTLVAAVAGLVLGILIIHMDDLVFLFSRGDTATTARH